MITKSPKQNSFEVNPTSNTLIEGLRVQRYVCRHAWTFAISGFPSTTAILLTIQLDDAVVWFMLIQSEWCRRIVFPSKTVYFQPAYSPLSVVFSHPRFRHLFLVSLSQWSQQPRSHSQNGGQGMGDGSSGIEKSKVISLDMLSSLKRF